jgi:hypothetical protein
MTVGRGAVWVLAHIPGLLYKVDPGSLRIIGVVDVGSYAVRPAVRAGGIWVGIQAAGGTSVGVDAKTLGIAYTLNCCLPSEGSDAEAFGSDWMVSWPTGAIVQWDMATYDLTRSIPLVESPLWGGPCLASVATGAGAVWVTVAPATRDSCPSLG